MKTALIGGCMKFLKGILFILGLMFFGVTLKMDAQGNELITIFVFYGFFGVSVLVAWSELRKLILEIKGK